MSWSYAYTSKMGIVKDSYHRLVLTVNVKPDPVEIPMQDLHKIGTMIAGGMRHIMFRIKSTYSESNCSIILNQLETYFSLLCNDPRNLTHDLFISMIAPAAYIITSDLFSDFVANTTDIKAHVGLFIASEVSPDGDKNSLGYREIIDNYGEVRKRIREKRFDIALGVTDVFNRKSLQHLFECHGDDIKVAIPGDVEMPNINARNVEFIHSRGANTYLYYSANVLTSLDREAVPTLEPLLEKYSMAKNNLATLLAKVIIQYGPLMCIDASLPLDYLENYFLFICDQLVYRTIQQAPTKVKRFVVMKEDIEDLVLESEEVECSDDVGWTRDALHKIPLRELTHHNAILAEKIQLANAFT